MSEIKHVKGLGDLQKFLNTLPAKLEANVMRGALRAGAKVIAAEAKSRVPVQSGALRDSIKISARSRRGTVTASIKAGGGDAWYAHLVEFTGAARHWIKVNPEARPARMTRRGSRVFSIRTLNRMAARGSLVIGGAFVGASLEHPGMRPRPFMRPALDAAAQGAILAAAEYMKKRLATKHGLDTADVAIEVGA